MSRMALPPGLSLDTYPSVPLMSYVAVRPLIQSGDVLLCSGSSSMSRMIQAATNSVWSHVAMILRLDRLDRLVVIESVESVGVRPCTMSRYVWNYNNTGAGYEGRIFIARHAAVNLADATLFCTLSRQAVDLFGCAYDTQQLAGIALRIVAAKLGFPAPPRDDDQAFICSEYCYSCFKSIGIEIPYDPRNFISPADFATCEDVTILWEVMTHHA